MPKGTTIICKKTNKSYTYGKRGRKPTFVQEYEKGDTSNVEVIESQEVATTTAE